MSRDLSLYLDDILKSIHKIRHYTANQTKSAVIADDKTFEAVVFNLQIIGEASKKIPNECLIKHPEIPWKDIIGLRNIIVHTYFRLSTDVIWDIVQTELSELHDCIVSIKANLSEP